MAAKKRSTKKRKSSTTHRKVGATRTVHVAAKRRTHSRSKMGALNSTAEILMGAVAGSFVTRVIQKNLPAPKTSTSTDLRPYTGLVVGGAAEFFGKKNLLIRSMGIGAIVEGARAIIADKYIPSMNSNPSMKGLPYTTAHVGKKKMNKLMGLKNALAGNKQQRKALAQISTYRGLAGTSSNVGFYGMYDGL
jgi:hypothetical protein